MLTNEVFEHLIEEGTGVKIIVHNGFQIKGVIKRYDSTMIEVETPDGGVYVFINALSTIVPVGRI